MLSWSKLPPRFVARMLSGHTVVGLAASALLYVLCLSGTAMVFHEEFARWEQPGAPEFHEIAPENVMLAAQGVLAGLDERPHHFFISLPVDAMPRVTVSTDTESWFADANGELAGKVDHPWTEFLTALHYYLTLPAVFGLTLVGILGALMTALVISGVLSHPKLFRDAFKFRLKGTSRLRETDTHNRLGAWAAPFHLVVAFTGAVLGLATLVAILLGPISGDGVEEFFAPIFGAEVEGAKDAAPLADISTALHNFETQYPDLVPWYVSFHDPATAGQSAVILAQHPRRVIYGDNYSFDADGELTGNTGLSDGDIGQQVAASLYPLHFGSFGGLWVKFAYGVLGVLACVMIASGFNIWLLKRRQRGRAVPALERAWGATIWGTPAVMAFVLLLASAGIASIGWLVGVFWTGLVLAIAFAVVVERFPAAFAFRSATGVLLVAVLIVHAARNASAFHSPAAWGVSISLLLIAVWLLRGSFRRQRQMAQTLLASRAVN